MGIVGKPLHRFAHGQLQHLRHVEVLPVALQRDFQHLGAVTLSVAIGAAQVHVAEELHLDVLKTGTATGGATPVTAVEAELGRRIATLLRQRRGGKQGADRVPRAHVADRIGARGLANGALIDKHHVGQRIGPQQRGVRAGRFGGAAKMAHQGGGQHILHQRGFARPAHTGDDHQTLQRQRYRDVAQIVLTHALQRQARGGCRDPALDAQAHPLAPAQVSPGQGVGLTQRGHRAIKHDLATTLAGARAHVDDAVGSQHHGGIVFHHHQRVARVAQAAHGLVDAGHVARVQPDAGLVQHKQGVDQ